MSTHKAIAMGHYTVRCFDPDGNLKWEDEFDNTVVDEGLNHILEVVLSNETAADATWFLGLTDGAPVTVDAGDTLASHAGWVEVTDYSGGVRLAWTAGSVASKSVSNTASTADFAITGTVTVGGAFLCGVNTGTAGVLYSAGAFTGGDKAVDSGDTLKVTATFTQAAA